MTGRTLTLGQLIKAQACESQLEKFRSLFGESVEVTLDLAHRSDIIDACFDIAWATDVLIDYETRQIYWEVRGERKAAFKTQHKVDSWLEVPREARRKFELLLWIEFYLKGKETEPIAPCRTVETLDSGELVSDQQEVANGN